MTALLEAIAIAQGLAAVLYTVCQAGLLLYASHRWPMLLAGSHSAPALPAWWPAGQEPRVLVQLPVRDEPAVVARLVQAVAALDWPHDRLHVQLLDDSGAGAAEVGAHAVATARARGIAIEHVQRAHAHGFKAGALAHGLELCDAEFVAVFDADFVPPSDFLRRMMPHFAAPGVGLAQARWGHLNRDANALTRAQAVMLDAHLLIEHPWRQRTGRFFNFNGTAGIWRRAAIAAAGGWSHDTLTEDLDLSYRAQLAGWRFVFDPTMVVPAELPAEMSAFRSQQYRWAKGALQTARKLLPHILGATLPWRVRAEAVVHLTANAGYPLLLVLSLLLAPVLFAAHTLPLPWLVALQLAVVAGGTLPIVLFLAHGQHLAGRRGFAVVADVGAALLLYAGLSWHLAGAVVAGLRGPTGEFVRTPKSGTLEQPSRGDRLAPRNQAARRPGLPRAAGAPELALAIGFTLLAVVAVAGGRPAGAPFLFALAGGLTWVGVATRTCASDAAAG